MEQREAAALILRDYANFLKRQQADFTQFIKSHCTVHSKNVKLFYPISVDVSPYEKATVLDIVESDNRILNKILSVFSVLCEEVKSLQEEAVDKHFVFLAFYGEFFQKSNASPSESIADNVKKLHLLTAFVKRCHDVTANFCNQIIALYSSGLINLKGVKLNYMLSSLGDLLVILVNLDCLIHCSPLRSHWTEYRKSVKSVYQKTSGCNRSSENLKSLDIVLNNIEDGILSDKIFYHSYNSLQKIKSSLDKKSLMAADDYLSYLKKCIMDLEKSSIDYYESLYVTQWIKVNALFVFHFHIFGNVDKKLFKSLFDVNVKAHSVPLYGLAVWHPEQFLLQHANVLCSSFSKAPQIILKARQSFVANKKQNLLKDVYIAQLLSCKWTVDMLQAFGVGESHLSAVEMNNRLELLLQGIKFVSQINFIATCFMSIHVTQGMPITKSSLMGICKFIEIIKGMQYVFKLKFASIVSSINLITQHLLFQIISQLVQVKKNLMADKNYANQRLDELSAIVIAERALNGPSTNLRRIVANVALSLVPSSVFPEDSYQKILLLLEKLDSIIDIHTKMNLFCDCSFMYWHKSVIQIYLQQVFDTKKDMTRLKCVVDALNDCAKKVDVYNKNSYEPGQDHFITEIEQYFNDGIVKPLGQQVETNLRLHVHSHLQLDSMNPFVVPVEDNTSLLDMQLLKFNNRYLSVGTAIEHYLSYMFYNLTTVVLHDWKTYGEMRQLAKFKFGLNTVEDNLPTQTLEQGLDVLEIMRNIHVFVSKYLYNLNNQVFIEESSNNKYLNTINIRHIANSIRTHGIGIMNTTVNFTYQFLRKKFQTFSQFMYDEQIKSRLIKDVRHFREASAQSEQMYGYKRAEKFNKGIRNLGLNENGLSYLDLFRRLISHIGNAMGYVRMIRSGGLHCCANATMFLPSLNEEDYDFLTHENSEIDGLVEESLHNLKHNIINLTSNFSHGTDYFKLLVEAFAPAFRKSDNMHLKSFFMIVPPLTLNFVEHMLLSKDKMNKKNKVGAAFTDDGFAMGLAYILKLLDQEEGMDSLNWFLSVNKHIAEERKSIQDQLINQTNHLQHALALTEKKLNLLEQEFQLLYFSFSSARIFFQ